MSGFQDHFSESAARYAAHRPNYPAELFAWLADTTARHERAWDCGTGNGQAAVGLSAHFAEVVATDPSHAQLSHAQRTEGVRYAAMTAEDSALANRSVDLITVAQALHWFDLSRFYAEVGRVLVPGGTLAVWTYQLLSISPEIDELVGSFYRDTLRGYWPRERAMVDAGYIGLPFPFAERAAPSFRMTRNWTLEQLTGYLDTWSAVTQYRKINGISPVGHFAAALEPMWGDNATPRRVTWPLELKVGTIQGQAIDR
jgi:SAM-dependent methyltransferase